MTERAWPPGRQVQRNTTELRDAEQRQQVVGDAEAEVEVEPQPQPQPAQDVGGIKEFDPDIHVFADPALRIPIEAFHPDTRDEVRRAYLLNGPTQPVGHNFPRKSGDNRVFREAWFKHLDWLEYSVSKDAAYCFYCFLFRQVTDENFGHDAFTKVGYRNWTNAYHGFPHHVGGPASYHNRARMDADDFNNQRSSIRHNVQAHTKEAEQKYEVRVTTSLDVATFLLMQGHEFRGHDESSSSLNKGNFLEMLEWYKARKEEVKVAFDELCPANARMTSHTIQKDLAKSCAREITQVIKEEIADSLFSILIDESRDISIAEQMAVIVRYVNKKGIVVERFLGLKHVKDTSADSLKGALVSLLAKHGLPIARLRGQGYDNASNMRGEFNGLQKLIRDENPYAFYIHGFAHQLRLVVVSVTSAVSSFDDFFNYLGLIVTSTGASCKRKDLEKGQIFTGRGKHQNTNLARPGDTRWGSHFRTLTRIELMWDVVVTVLSMLMLKVLRITNDLSLLLQRKDQNIVQAISLLVDVKTRLVNLRNDGWDALLDEVKSFYVVPRWGRSRLAGITITQEHHYRVHTFFAAIDAIITEMDHRFNEVSSELLVCFSCLDPRDSFSNFNVDKIARLTEIYDQDFSDDDRSRIRGQLETFIIHVQRVDEFIACSDLGSLAAKLVQTRKHNAFPLVYRLIELSLLLPVATASHNKISDGRLNHLILCYIEKEIFKGLDFDKVKKTFQAMKERRMNFPKPARNH
ncbi:hypothetical protein BS78_K226400 [Paspalum vaginatum]|uniref:TTF-type domain-containing protein n=1 Tax=Paspalum vaginatum TaxID=158149 RepID=A0A9W8CF25_9POAL|nr:hypothetical protein BS78_K226400 [Paspalum vaginatum]